MEDHSHSRNRCLWIGNLDDYVTEYELLKIVQHFGDIEKFDFPTNRRIVNNGKSRRFAFVTYRHKRDAANAQEKLHNTFLHKKYISVYFSHVVENDGRNDEPKMSDSCGNNQSSGTLHPDEKIRAIQNKLESMETSSSDLLPLSFGSLSENGTSAGTQANLYEDDTTIGVPAKRARY